MYQSKSKLRHQSPGKSPGHLNFWKFLVHPPLHPRAVKLFKCPIISGDQMPPTQLNCQITELTFLTFPEEVRSYLTKYWKFLKTGSLDNAIREFSLAKPSWYMSHYNEHSTDEGHSPETSGHMFKFFGTLNNVLNFNFL